MGWADRHIEKLKKGEAVQFRPVGNSMKGRIESGQLVTVIPVHENAYPLPGDVVLCSIGGRQLVHLVVGCDAQGRYQIANNKGHVNGWTKAVYGVVTSVED